MSRQG